MKTKILKILTVFLTFTGLEFIYFICGMEDSWMYYIFSTKDIIGFLLRLVTHTIYYVGYFWCITVLVQEVLTNRLNGVIKKWSKLIFWGLIARFIIDIIICVFTFILKDYMPVMSLGLEFLFILTTFLIAFKFIGKRDINNNITKGNKLIIIFGVVLMLSIIFIYSINTYMEMNIFLNKYITSKASKVPDLMFDVNCNHYLYNYFAKINFDRFILCLSLSIILFYIFTLLYKYEKLTEQNIPPQKKIVYIKRIVLGVVICIGFYYMCFFMVPNTVISGFLVEEHNVLDWPTSGFCYDYKIISIRKDILKDKDYFYEIQVNNIYYNKKKVASFLSKPLASCDWFIRYINKQGGNSLVCQTDKIIYVDNGNINVVKINSLNNMKENVAVTSFLERLIESGSFDILEFSSKYMLKYDNDFIMPYLKRYAQGDLTENELEINSQVNMDYMKKFAKRVLRD